MNGNELFGTPGRETVTGGFYLPYGNPKQTSTFGEMIIIRGTVSDLNMDKMEGYLAHKWGLGTQMPNSHLYKKDLLCHQLPKF